jgi:hypothetical protein
LQGRGEYPPAGVAAHSARKQQTSATDQWPWCVFPPPGNVPNERQTIPLCVGQAVPKPSGGQVSVLASVSVLWVGAPAAQRLKQAPLRFCSLPGSEEFSPAAIWSSRNQNHILRVLHIVSYLDSRKRLRIINYYSIDPNHPCR